MFDNTELVSVKLIVVYVLNSNLQSSSLQLPAVATSDFEPIRRGDIPLLSEENVEIHSVRDNRATISKTDGSQGTVPVSFLQPSELPGETFVDQIRYRRMWFSKVDGLTAETPKEITPFSPKLNSISHGNSPLVLVSDGRPEFLKSLNDTRIREGDSLQLRPLVSSSVPFSLTWRGPAIESGRAKVQSENGQSFVEVPSVVPSDAGPYSAVAENEFGISSSIALVTVASKPASPSNVYLNRTGAFSLQIRWTPSTSKPVRYGIECRREGSNTFFSAATGLTRNKFSIRGFLPFHYSIRVYSYNTDFRSRPSEEVAVDFSVPHLYTGSDSSQDEDRTPFSRSESV